MITIFVIIGVIFLLLLLLIFVIHRKLKKQTPTPIIKKHPLLERMETMVEESSDDKMWSATRVAYVFTMLVSNSIRGGALVFLVLYNHEFPVIPQGVIFIYAISNGVSSVAKVWQKREERFSQSISNLGSNDTDTSDTPDNKI